ncbi:MAG TPA: pirin family protein [Chitinophagaceae bacterium]|nr:pirin family protein [Chitinophagaceae bacterium]
MKIKIQRATERGNVNFGWLNSNHSFSFGHWYDPTKMNFGALRVLNDDVVKGGQGFGAHPHDNMEIVSIPLKGALAHKDSTGTDGIIKTGDVQIMSAGSGIKHSEFNASKTEEVNFLQIWVQPKEENIKPRYEQKTFDIADRKNTWQIVVSPDEKDGGVWINQDAVFALAHIEKDAALTYKNKFSDNGVYLFILEGEAEVNLPTGQAGGEVLHKRDAIEVSDADEIEIIVKSDTELLAIEVPMLK